MSTRYIQRKALLLLLMILPMYAFTAHAKQRLDNRDWHYQDYDDKDHRMHSAVKIVQGQSDLVSGNFNGRLLIRGTGDAVRVRFAAYTPTENKIIDCPQPDCLITIQFDDNPPIQQTSHSPLVPESGQIQFSHGKDLVAQMQAANSLRISVPVKDEGMFTFEFSTSGLEWPRDDQ